MERKTSILLLSGLLLASFFVPFIPWQGFSMSGFDFVVSSHTPEIKYLLLAIPAIALFLLVSSVSFESELIYSRFILHTPLLTLISMFMLLATNKESRISMGAIDPLNISFLGLWIIVAASVLVLFIRKKRSVHIYG